MIGQKRIRKIMNDLMTSTGLPPFIIFVGEQGCGKKTLMKELANTFKFNYWCENVKVETMRFMMRFAYNKNTSDSYAFVIPDADGMSTNAKNVILKITEEPPRNSTFFMSVSNDGTMLDTIKSRAVVFQMEHYAKSELMDYIESYPYNRSSLDLDFVLRASETIADVKYLLEEDVDAFQKHINTLLDKADRISFANLAKSEQLMAFKDGDEGFDVRMFIRALQNEAVYRIKEDYEPAEMYRDIVIKTSSLLNQVSIKSVNKGFIYSDLIIALKRIEEEWR